MVLRKFHVLGSTFFETETASGEVVSGLQTYDPFQCHGGFFWKELF